MLWLGWWRATHAVFPVRIKLIRGVSARLVRTALRRLPLIRGWEARKSAVASGGWKFAVTLILQLRCRMHLGIDPGSQIRIG